MGFCPGPPGSPLPQAAQRTSSSTACFRRAEQIQHWIATPGFPAGSRNGSARSSHFRSAQQSDRLPASYRIAAGRGLSSVGIHVCTPSPWSERPSFRISPRLSLERDGRHAPRDVLSAITPDVDAGMRDDAGLAERPHERPVRQTREVRRGSGGCRAGRASGGGAGYAATSTVDRAGNEDQVPTATRDGSAMPLASASRGRYRRHAQCARGV
jgi:hypothetical protein